MGLLAPVGRITKQLGQALQSLDQADQRRRISEMSAMNTRLRRPSSPAPLQIFRHDPAIYMLIQAAVRFHQLISGNG